MTEMENLDGNVVRSRVTSLICQAGTLQALVNTIACESVDVLARFDYCILVLPEMDGTGLRVWRAERVSAFERLEAARDALSSAHSLLASVLNRGASALIHESELQSAAPHGLGQEAKSALALPLSFGGDCFGLLCFASTRADAYASDDAERLQWLADVVAAASQAQLARMRAEALGEKLCEMENLRGGFVTTLVRDMRFPLTNVLGLLELFESKLQAREPFDMEDRQLLNTAIENGDRMRQLLDNLLEVAQQQERPLSLEPHEVSVERLLEETAEPLRGEAALRGVELNVGVSAKSLSMYVDERQARRAVHHMLAAALDATPDGGAVRIEAQSIMGTRSGDDGRRFVVVSIADSGGGIPAEEVPFVFDAFWQSSQSSSKRGRGPGLAIARRIAAAHGGNVTVRSQSGVGTTYSIVLPATQPEAASVTHRILIVEDMPELLLLLRKLVERMGYQAETALDGRAALKILREKAVGLVLTDWSMPGMNGGDLIMEMKHDERLRDVPTIVLTGHDTDAERREAERAGCDRFLVKPVKRDELQHVINELLQTAIAVR